MTTVTLNRTASREVDLRAIEHYGMNGLVLMENAGRGVTDTLVRLGINGSVCIACGKGNNAGDGFVIARHLELRGFDTKVMLFADPQDLHGDALANFHILEKTEIPIALFGTDEDWQQIDRCFIDADWIVDALLGTGAYGEPRAPLDWAIDSMNDASAHKMAIDLPSGLDCDTGTAAAHTFRADHTCTFVAAKPGFFCEQGPRLTGEIHVLDIGAPRQLMSEILSEG